MPEPFRDEATAALERIANLEAENEELRRRIELARGKDDKALLERQLAATLTKAIDGKHRVAELEESVREQTEVQAAEARAALWVARVVLAAFFAGILVGGMLGAFW